MNSADCPVRVDHCMWAEWACKAAAKDAVAGFLKYRKLRPASAKYYISNARHYGRALNALRRSRAAWLSNVAGTGEEVAV